MSCSDCRERMLELPLERIEAELGSHLCGCTACRRLATLLVAEESAIHEAIGTYLDRPVEDAVQAALTATTPTKTRFAMLESLHVFVIAAAAAAVVLLGISVDRGGTELPDATTTAEVDDTIRRTEARVAEVGTVAWNEKTEVEWGKLAHELRGLWVALSTTPETAARRKTEFALLTQLGRAAENANSPVAPFYDKVDGKAVNVGWYMAAQLVIEDRTLLEGLPDDNLRASVAWYVDGIDAGEFAIVTLDLSP